MRRLRLPPRPGLASLLATVLIGTGCTPGAGLGPRMDGPQRIADARSMVVLPPELEADRLMVWREVQDNYIDERVVLANQTATAGENVIDVHTYWRGTAHHPALFAGPMPNPFAADKISKRIADAFGDWAEVSAPRDRANRHGPYRYVAATADGVRCVLAWQMIDAVAAITRESETYAVEYRVCDPKREPEQLVALFDRIGLAPDL